MYWFILMQSDRSASPRNMCVPHRDETPWRSLFPEEPAMRVSTPRQPCSRLLWRHGLGASGFSEAANQHRPRAPHCLWLVSENFIENLLRCLLDVARARKGRSSPPGPASGGHNHWSSIVSTLTIISWTHATSTHSSVHGFYHGKGKRLWDVCFQCFVRKVQV